MKRLAAVAAPALLLSLAACGGGSSGFKSASDLRDAAVKAGLNCPTFVEDDVKSHDDYKSAGHCEGGESARFYVWGDKDHAQNFMGGLVAFEGQALVGDDWGIKANDVDRLKDKMGGKVMGS